MRINPFLCRREGTRRLSIVLGIAAVSAWEAYFFGQVVPVEVWDNMVMSDVYGMSLWAIGLPLCVYLAALLPGAVLWIIAGFRAPTTPTTTPVPAQAPATAAWPYPSSEPSDSTTAAQ